ncbi:MAG TPA: hypothetical protein VJV75_04325 [Candidatus Polarisedimenticolia bacterium]|nr:hypothetical protein [Candidatus Polarisedimenticolia bacterium]
MFWSTAVAALSGALAALIAHVLVRNRKEKRNLYVIVLVVGFIVLNGAGRAIVMPHIRVWEARSSAKQVLRDNRAFALLTAEHPEVGTKFEEMLVAAVRRGDSPDQVRVLAVRLGREIVGPYFGQYAPRASDAALAQYATTLIELLEGIGAKDKRGCYALLFGAGSEGADYLPSMTPEQQKRMSDALADVVESAIKAPQKAPESAEAEALTQDLIQRLAQHHGQEFIASLALLANPMDPKVDRAEVCSVVTRMYQEVVGLPDPQRGNLLRHLLAGPGPQAPEATGATQAGG